MTIEKPQAVAMPKGAASELDDGLERTPSPEYLAFRAAGCETVGDKKRWDAAVAFEREECAKLAEAHFIFGHSVAGPHFAAVLANKIRIRSNVNSTSRSKTMDQTE